MTWRASPTDWATFDLQLSVLEPAASEYYVGGPLSHLSAIIPTNPSYMLVDVSDDARMSPSFNVADTDPDVEPLKVLEGDTGLDFDPGTLPTNPEGASDTD
jgi:hypothetical protein